MQKLIFGRYDYAAFLTFIAYAAGSVIFPVVMPDLAHDLNFPLNDGGMGAAGALHFVRSGAMVVSMACSGFLAARFGLRETILPGLFLMSGAVAAAVFAPNYAFLIVVMLFAGMGEGALEALATPFVQELHRDNEPGRYVNFSHGFWSVGVALATVGAGVMLNCRIPWQVALLTVALCGVPGIVLLFLPSKSEQRKLENAKGQSTAEVFANTVKIFRNGRFWLYFIAIFLPAAVNGALPSGRRVSSVWCMAAVHWFPVWRWRCLLSAWLPAECFPECLFRRNICRSFWSGVEHFPLWREFLFLLLQIFGRCAF